MDRKVAPTGRSSYRPWTHGQRAGFPENHKAKPLSIETSNHVRRLHARTRRMSRGWPRVRATRRTWWPVAPHRCWNSRCMLNKTLLEQLREMTVVVADSGDVDSILR